MVRGMRVGVLIFLPEDNLQLERLLDILFYCLWKSKVSVKRRIRSIKKAVSEQLPLNRWIYIASEVKVWGVNILMIQVYRWV